MCQAHPQPMNEADLLLGRLPPVCSSVLIRLSRAIQLDSCIVPDACLWLVQAGGRKAIQLGDKEIDWDDNFRLYMCTKLPNPQYGPEVAGKTIIINYSVTQQVSLCFPHPTSQRCLHLEQRGTLNLSLSRACHSQCERPYAAELKSPQLPSVKPPGIHDVWHLNASPRPPKREQSWFVDCKMRSVMCGVQGLTDQLLNFVVRHERPDLEEARESLVKQMSSDRSLLQQLEDTLLSELSNATGNILDNTVRRSLGRMQSTSLLLKLPWTRLKLSWLSPSHRGNCSCHSCAALSAHQSDSPADTSSAICNSGGCQSPIWD